MHEAIACTLLVAALAVGGCGQTTTGPDAERPAPPDQFVVTTQAGTQLSGPAARIDIRYVDAAQAPDVEISFSASAGTGRTWSVVAAALPEFLDARSLTARVVDSRITAGTATVQASVAGQDATAAPGGLLSLRVYGGRLMGETSRMGDELAARFEGPFVVTCAVPAALMSDAPQAADPGSTQPTLIVDEAFESEPCRRHELTSVAGRGRL
jgi:hypothetical protein